MLGITPDGKKAVAAYFIMGRSVNSRNRVFIEERDGIRTEAHDPALMKDPHLIIYHPVREAGNGLIVTNGDQTDTIWEYLAKGESWEAALRTRMFEDDGPNWTPRISGIQANDGSYKMSILKAADPVGNACARFFTSTNQYRYMLDAWHPVRNPNSDLPRAGQAAGAAVPCSYMVHDASYLRLKTLSLAYTFDFRKKEKFLFREITVGVSGDNIYLWKYYNGFDPDISSEGTSSILRRADIGAYPKARTFMFNLNLKF